MDGLSDPVRVYSLDNGMRVALRPREASTLYGRVRVRSGSFHESPDESGLAHMVEHCLINGGSQRFSPEEVDRVRSEIPTIRASTNHTHTRFSGEMLPEDIALFLRTISDITLRPRFDESRVNEERKRILREIVDDRGAPEYEDEQRFGALYYGPASLYMRETLGSPKIIQDTTAAGLRAFHRRNYSPSNMDLILVGALPSDIEAMVAENFSQEPARPVPVIAYPPIPLLEGARVLHTPAPDLLVKGNEEESNASLYIRFTGPDATEPSYLPALLLNAWLGGNKNSRLFQKISRRQGMAYRITSAYNNRDNRGWISIDASVRAKDIDAVVASIFEEMEDMREHPITEASLRDLKKRMRYAAASALASNTNIADDIESTLDGRWSMEEKTARTSEITAESLRDAARLILPQSKEQGAYCMLLRDPLRL